MPRISGTNVQDGAATTGRAYEPTVTPNVRDDDDTSVLGNRNAGLDKDVHGQFGVDSEHAEGQGDRREGDVYDEGGLQPTYEVMERTEDGHDHDNDHHHHRDHHHDDERRVERHEASRQPMGQTTYTGNADRPYGAERFEHGGRTEVEREHDDRARYAEERHGEKHRDEDRDTVRNKH